MSVDPNCRNGFCDDCDTCECHQEEPAATCEQRGRHSRFGWMRRRGPFWRRRTEVICGDCGEVMVTTRRGGNLGQ